MPIPLNQANLPYPDPLHPQFVHFVIAMVFFAFLCDVIGYFSHNHRLFEVSFWNMFVASAAIFVAVIFGQFEAGLAQAYEAAQPILNEHTITGWSLSAIVVAITAWRFVIRSRDPLKIPPAYLGVSMFLLCLVCFQVYLGTQLVWEYGLHVTPVEEAINKGVLK